MAPVGCSRPQSKRDFRSTEDGMTYDSRKMHKSLNVQLPLTAQIAPRQGEHTKTLKTETASSSSSCSSSQQQRSQEKLREIFGQRKYKNLKEKFNFEDSDDSDEEEEQKGIPNTECEDDAEGLKWTIKAIDAMFGRPVSVA